MFSLSGKTYPDMKSGKSCIHHSVLMEVDTIALRKL